MGQECQAHPPGTLWRHLWWSLTHDSSLYQHQGENLALNLLRYFALIPFALHLNLGNKIIQDDGLHCSVICTKVAFFRWLDRQKCNFMLVLITVHLLLWYTFLLQVSIKTYIKRCMETIYSNTQWELISPKRDSKIYFWKFDLREFGRNMFPQWYYNEFSQNIANCQILKVTELFQA